MQINNCFILQVCVRRVMKHFEKLSKKHSRTKSCICLYLEELLRIFRALQISRVSINACWRMKQLLIAKTVVILHFFCRSSQIGQPKTIDALGKGIKRNAHTGVAFDRFKAHKLSFLKQQHLEQIMSTAVEIVDLPVSTQPRAQPRAFPSTWLPLLIWTVKSYVYCSPRTSATTGTSWLPIVFFIILVSGWEFVPYLFLENRWWFS